MNIGTRIKLLRKEKGLSVDYVADKLGKNRATIYRYESNDIEKLPYPILIPLADILGTTPMNLMGFEENEKQKIEVTKEEKHLLDNYNALNSTGKEKLLDYSNDLIENSKYLYYEEPITIAAHDDDLTEDEINEMDRRIKEFKEKR